MKKFAMLSLAAGLLAFLSAPSYAEDHCEYYTVDDGNHYYDCVQCWCGPGGWADMCVSGTDDTTLFTGDSECLPMATKERPKMRAPMPLLLRRLIALKRAEHSAANAPRTEMDVLSQLR